MAREGDTSYRYAYWEDLDRLVLSVFDREPVDLQPRYIAHMGCGDGELLQHMHELVSRRSLRGHHLASLPLTLIGIDESPHSLTAARLTLEGLDHLLLTGDAADPEKLVCAMRGAGVDDPHAVLHLRLFQDRERAESLTGCTPLSSTDGAMSVLTGHFERWERAVGAHGIILVEAHTVEQPKEGHLKPAAGARDLHRASSLATVPPTSSFWRPRAPG